jgi:hypothetical protein
MIFLRDIAQIQVEKIKMKEKKLISTKLNEITKHELFGGGKGQQDNSNDMTE